MASFSSLESKGLRTDDVIYCTICKAHWGSVIVIWGCVNKMYLILTFCDFICKWRIWENVLHICGNWRWSKNTGPTGLKAWEKYFNMLTHYCRKDIAWSFVVFCGRALPIRITIIEQKLISNEISHNVQSQVNDKQLKLTECTQLQNSLCVGNISVY